MGITRRTIISNYTPILTLQGQTHSRNYQFNNFQSQLNKKQGEENLDMATNGNKMKLIPFKEALVIIGVSFLCCSILGANGYGEAACSHCINLDPFNPGPCKKDPNNPRRCVNRGETLGCVDVAGGTCMAEGDECQCKSSWSREDYIDYYSHYSDGDCTSEQHGCPNCNADPSGSWCAVKNPGCVTDHGEGYSYC